MDNYEDDKARYWRNCDLWTFNEVQFLLNGQWPEDKPPPSSLNLILLETEFDVDHPLEDGSVMTTTETEAKVINPLPFIHGLRDVIEDAVASGALTVIETRNAAKFPMKYKRDLESRFRPAQVIAWVASRGCFPDFPFAHESPAEAEQDADSRELAAWFECEIERDQREAAEKRVKELEAQLTTPLLNGPAGAAKPQSPKRTRRDQLSPLIERASSACKNPTDAQAVFALLKSWASDAKPQVPLIGVTEDGRIQWRDGNDKPKELTISALRKRLKPVR